MNPSTAQAHVLIDELVRGGLREAVLCPGSRNAPLSYALYAADLAGRVRLHVRIDERSAGFLALGLARGSGVPVIVVTTSGTAVANLHPAVLEASHARVPLVVLSADRPAELLGSGANQTVEQHGMFGSAVRQCLTLQATGAPDNARSRAAVCRILAAAVGARTGNPGPVQLNVALREPLIPNDAALADGLGGRADGAPWTRVAMSTVDAPLELDLTVPTLVVAGDGARAHPELGAVPTVAEPSAPAPRIAVHPLAVPGLQPDQVVVTGRPTLHRSVQQLLAADVAVHVLAEGAVWTDVAATARSVGTRVVASGGSTPQWVQQCAAATAQAEATVRAELATGPPTGLHVARAVAEGLHSGDLLVLGSSNPVRDASYVGLPKPGARVLVNRGVAGIDGTVSTAIGAALAHDGNTVALMGDLTFLHDSGGLLVGPDEPRPELTIVVANDDGGGIFALLEQGAPEQQAVFERVFGTPHGTDLAALCAAHHVPHRVVTVAALPDALARRRAGLQVVEVRTRRAGLRALHARLRLPRTVGDRPR